MAYDLIIVGGGPAGYNAAERAAEAGLKTVLFEERALGGVCLNEGCIPTKTLLNSAKIYESAIHGEPFGVKVEGASLDHASVVARKNKVVKTLVSGVAAKMKGAKVEVVYSPVDAVKLAKENPDKEVVFLGVGFETTAPGTAAAVLTAQEQGAENFSLFSMLKTVEPALRALIASEGFNVQGFLCPGHVATILGEEGFRFLPEEYGLPAVISGFEGEDILFSVYLLLRQLADQKPRVQNEYTRAVAPQGNPLARAMMEKCFVARRDIWRGLGEIEASGLALRDELSAFDAEKKFSLRLSAPAPAAVTACRCGEVITGRLEPGQCPLFSRRCTPEDPVGPCMVSSEGACAAAYKYQGIE